MKMVICYSDLKTYNTFERSFRMNDDLKEKIIFGLGFLWLMGFLVLMIIVG